jgi:hypothetical protein
MAMIYVAMSGNRLKKPYMHGALFMVMDRLLRGNETRNPRIVQSFKDERYKTCLLIE